MENWCHYNIEYFNPWKCYIPPLFVSLLFSLNKMYISPYRLLTHLLLYLFLVFDLINTIINNEMFWTSFSDCFLLLCENTMHFCMLTMYLKALQNSLFYSGCDSFVCYTYIIRLSSNNDYFIRYSLILTAFIFWTISSLGLLWRKHLWTSLYKIFLNTCFCFS